METRFCPMCGRSNQPDAEECEFCHARLIPLGEFEKGPENESIFVDLPLEQEPQPEVPEWLKDLRDLKLDETEGEVDEGIIEPVEDLPEWLKSGDDQEGSQSSKGSEILFSESLKKESIIGPEVKPVGSVAITPAGNTENQRPNSSSDEDKLPEADLPDWLKAMPGQEWEGESDKEEDFFGGVVPPFVDFDESLLNIGLSDSRIEPEETAEERLTLSAHSAAGEAEEELGGKIPEDLEDILEKSKHPETEEKRIEVAGPLAGLEDILPVEPFIAEEKKGIEILSTLLVSEKQRKHAELFEQLIADEGKPKPIKSAAAERSSPGLRIFIFLIILAASLFGMLFNPFPGKPTAMNVGVFDAMQALAKVSPRSPVLLIVDYEAGDFAEMQTVGFGLIDQLMVKGAYLVLLSTNPLGALQGDRLIRQINLYGDHEYKEQTNWVNLGYLPGSAAGIQQFIQSPRNTLPVTTNSQNIWAGDEMKNVQKIGDFALVVVMTENASHARTWIEQLNGNIAQNQMVFLVSSQIEPIVEPYYATISPQIGGLVAGINGGAIYETQAGRNGLALMYWEAYGLIVSSSVVLILFGVLVNTFGKFRQSNSKKTEGK